MSIGAGGCLWREEAKMSVVLFTGEAHRGFARVTLSQKCIELCVHGDVLQAI